MSGWTNERTSVVGCCAVMLGPRSSVVLSLFLSSLLFVTVSPFSSILLYLSSSLFRPVAVFHPLLTSRSLFSFSLVFSAFFQLSVFLFSSSRRTCLLKGLELAGGHYGGYSVGFSRLSKAHERVCPPRVKELPREQVHLLLRLSLLLLFLLLPLSLFPFPFLRCAAHCQPALCPLRGGTLGFYLFSLITAVGM